MARKRSDCLKTATVTPKEFKVPAIASVISELESVMRDLLKEVQRTTLKAFRLFFFTHLFTDSDKSLIYQPAPAGSFLLLLILLVEVGCNIQ